MEFSEMKVLLVISKMGKGGAQQVVLELANGLVRAGMDVDLLIFFRTPQDQSVLTLLDSNIQILYPGIKLLLPTDHGGLFQKVIAVFWLPLWALYICIMGQLEDYRIIHANLALASWFSNWLHVFHSVFRRRSIRFVETFHADFASLRVRPWESKLFVLLWKHLDALVFELRRSDMDYISQRIPAGRQEYIPFGISAWVTNNKIVSTYERKLGQQVVLTVSRLSPEKHIDQLLRVIAHLRETTQTPFTYLLVGDGPNADSQKKLVKSLGLEHVVQFLGYMNENEIPWKDANVFLVTGVDDLVGIAGLRAASFGVPVVSYQVDSFWHSKHNLFWNSPNLGDIAEHIKKILEHRDFWSTESARSKRVFQKYFSSASMVQHYLKLYDDLSSNHQ